jgi:hypothetical protein
VKKNGAEETCKANWKQVKEKIIAENDALYFEYEPADGLSSY